VKPKEGPAPGQYIEKEGLADATSEPLEIIIEKKPRVQTAKDKERRKPNSIF
jgi:hypothetical protein